MTYILHNRPKHKLRIEYTVTWNEAAATCKDSSLVTIKNHEEMNSILRLIRSKYSYPPIASIFLGFQVSGVSTANHFTFMEGRIMGRNSSPLMPQLLNFQVSEEILESGEIQAILCQMLPWRTKNGSHFNNI